MTVYDIGDYRVQQLNYGWKVSWQGPKGNRHHLDLDLQRLIRQYVDGHLETIARLIALLEQDDPTALLDDTLGFCIIADMPNSDTIPGQDLQPNQVKQWHREQLLKGYNRTNNTQFTYDMIRDRLP